MRIGGARGASAPIVTGTFGSRGSTIRIRGLLPIEWQTRASSPAKSSNSGVTSSISTPGARNRGNLFPARTKWKISPCQDDEAHGPMTSGVGRATSVDDNAHLPSRYQRLKVRAIVRSWLIQRT